MSVTALKSAEVMEQNIDTITPYEVVAMLLDGALERINQAKTAMTDGEKEDTEVLITKTMGIIGGLRQSLELDKGGELALNLDGLYSYMLERLDDAAEDCALEPLDEVADLLGDVKSGWDGIAETQEAQSQYVA